ncbi:hypothetical protein [Sporosarcina sp. A2]|uniref:hypothetical protein n=1 Tax=Sporosarcina sp. A2 TaxID=3393449 RepID=UPI003D7BB946
MPATPSVTLSVISSTTVMVQATAGVDTSHLQFDRSWVSNNGGSNDFEVACPTGQTTTQYFAMPTAPGSYTVSVRARIGSTPSSWVSRGFVVEDTTPPPDPEPQPDPDPSITSLSVDGENAVYASWSVSNTAYMRSTNSMYVYLSGPGGSGQYGQGYLSSSTRSWSKGTDGAGNAFVVGQIYTIWIYVYNNSGQSFSASRSFVFTKSKPIPFNWTNAKTSGGMYNLTAIEWNGLLDKVNEFRGYKGLSQLTFNRSVGSGAISGYIVLAASSFNAAANAVNGMSPSTGSPTASTDNIVTASSLNALRNALNSI